MNPKLYHWIIIITLLSVGSYALNICSNPAPVLQTCSIITPSLNCGVYNYSLYDENSSLINYGSLSPFSGNIYYFNITLNYGRYVAVLCDASSRNIIVDDVNNTSISLNIQGNNDLTKIIIVGIIVLVLALIGLAYAPGALVISGGLMILETSLLYASYHDTAILIGGMVLSACIILIGIIAIGKNK
jgi:hypothetical protein